MLQPMAVLEQVTLTFFYIFFNIHYTCQCLLFNVTVLEICRVQRDLKKMLILRFFHFFFCNMPMWICFTECSVGVYGKDCAENCSMTCGDPGVCDKVTGHCNGSCLPGWEGNMCQNGNNVYKIMFMTS